MEKVEKEFLEGVRKTKIVTEEEGREIFSWIKASQRYSFNLSHGVSYATYSYQFAYAKAHFPKAFFVASIRAAYNKIKPFEEIQDLIDNANIMGVDILPPSIKYLNEECDIINKKIVMGLAGIKCVGKSVIRAIKNTVEKENINVAGLNWAQFLLRFMPVIKSDAFKSLIKAGALDVYNRTRTQMLYEYSILQDLRKKDKDLLVEKYKEFGDVISAINWLIKYTDINRKPGKLKDKHLSYLRGVLHALENPPYDLQDDISTMARYEKEALGTNLVFMDIYKYDLSLRNCSCYDVFHKRCPKKIKLVAKIDRISEWITKKNNKKMAFVTLRDESAVCDAVMFNETYMKYKDSLNEGDVYFIFGNQSQTSDGLIINDIRKLHA